MGCIISVCIKPRRTSLHNMQDLNEIVIVDPNVNPTRKDNNYRCIR